MSKSSRRVFTALVFVAVACGARAAPATAAEDWTWPVKGPVITPYRYDEARPYSAGMHRGIDIGAPLGTKVVVAHAGTVTYAAPLASSGLTVAIATADGAYATSYLHLSRIAVSRGATVEAGDEVGDVGTTGTRSASEPHLHFGVRRLGEPDAYVDPLSLLPPSPTTPRIVPPASVPVRDQARAGPVPASPPPSLTVPLGRSLVPPARAPEPAGGPIGLPGVVPRGEPVPARIPAPARTVPGAFPRRGHSAGSAALRAPGGAARRVPGAGPSAMRDAGYGREGGRPRLATAQAARDSAATGWGKVIALGGLGLFLGAIAGRRLGQLGSRLVSRHLASLRGQRTQPGTRPPGPPRHLAGVSQMS